MYEVFFGLQQRPFSVVPNAEDFVAVVPQQDALDSLVHCVTQARGIAVITSASGMGKTMLCKRLSRLLQQNCRSLFLNAEGMESRLGLMQAILFEMNMGYLGLTEQEARLKFLQVVRDAQETKKTFLLILDDAHALTPRIFEELKSFTEFAPDGEHLIQVVLSGSFELEEKLTDPALTGFNQRIGLQICLEPLSLEHSARFISESFRQCGEPNLFNIMTEEALEMICHASDGNPRCLAQLTDHACLLAFADEIRPITRTIVRKALENLKELPLRWSEIPGEGSRLEAEHMTQPARISELDLDAEDAIAILHPGAIAPTELETDEFPIPEFLRASAGSSELDHKSQETQEIHLERKPLQIAGFDHDDSFAVYEVGAGVPSSQDSQAEAQDDHESGSHSFSDWDGIYEFPVASSQEMPYRHKESTTSVMDTDMKEFAVHDRYALLDRFFELPEERRQNIDLSLMLDDSASHPTKGCVPPQSTPVSISEEDVLELVQQIRKSVEEKLAPAGHAPHDIPTPHQFSSMQGGPRSEMIVEETVDAPPPAKETPEQPAPPQTTERRFANLFTRLRQRRREVQREQDS